MPEFTRPVLACALVALVGVIFLIGAAVRKRPDVALIAMLVIYVAIVVATVFGLERATRLPVPPVG